MKAQRFLRNDKGQVTLEAAFLIALLAAVCLASLGPLRRSLQGFFLGKGNEMSTLKFDETSTGKIKTKTDTKYKETNTAGAVKQDYSQNDNTDDTSVYTAR